MHLQFLRLLAGLGGVALAQSSSAPTATSTAGAYPTLPQTSNSTLVPFELATHSDDYVTARDGKLYLAGKDFTFSCFNNVSMIHMRSADC